MRWWTCAVLLFVAVKANESERDEWLTVNIEQGPVRGRRDSSGDLWTFHGIPYATAPTGKDKFKAPLPPASWTEPFDAIDKGIICPQAAYFTPIMPDTLVQQEDCLIASIYVPDTKEKNLSVLVYVHGGAFQMGFGEWFKANNLMKEKDYIRINFNYRLGIYGFLCLGTKDAPGNAGMKDQVALLRWVQKNIAAFGGNPNDVTIIGGSAGSAAVDLLMFAKSAEGLFHKVIPESGAALAAFTVQSNPLQNAKDHAKELNFTNVDDINALEEFYKTLPQEILTADNFLSRTDSTFLFSPCVERETDEAFLTKSPFSVLKSGDYKKVPVLYGFANMEGLLRIEFFDVWKDSMNENFPDFLPANLKFKSEAEKEIVARQIKEFYFGDKPIGYDNILQYVNYYSDLFFTYPALWAVKLHAKAGHNQIYLYEYSFVDKDVPIVPHTNVQGANHCAQTMAVCDGRHNMDHNEDDITDEYKNMKKIIREFWHNFLKAGKPVPEGSSLPAWPAVGADRSPHMSLGQTVELRGVLLEERTRFWDSIYEKYYREPIPPPQPTHSHTDL